MSKFGLGPLVAEVESTWAKLPLLTFLACLVVVTLVFAI